MAACLVRTTSMSSVEDLLRCHRRVAPSQPRSSTLTSRVEESQFAQGLGLGLLLSMPFWLAVVGLAVLH